MADTVLIDREHEADLFRAMLAGSLPERILRLEGLEKMGKSRLLREYQHIAMNEHQTSCALVDLRSKRLSHGDVLQMVVEQIGEPSFHRYRQVRRQLSRQPRIELSSILQVFSELRVQSAPDETTAAYQRRRLTAAFTQDLRAMPPEQPVVLLFDQTDDADPAIQTWLTEHLLLGLCRLPHVYVVLAGRQLPQPPVTWLAECSSHVLPPVSLAAHVKFCTDMKMEVSQEIIEAFHSAFKGRPGFFAEFIPQLARKEASHAS